MTAAARDDAVTPEHGWPDVKPGDKSKYRTCRCGFRYQREQDLFDHVFAAGRDAALPALREQIAQEIEGSPADEWPGGTISAVVAHAARIVRKATP